MANPNHITVGRKVIAYNVWCIVLATFCDHVEVRATQTRKGIRKGDVFKVSYEVLCG